MESYPVFLDLRGREALIVGGGPVAARKAEALARAGAKISVLAPTVLPALQQAVEASGGTLRLEVFDGQLIGNPVLVFSATGIDAVDRAVHDAARARGVPVNVADTPELCDFILPAIIDRSPVIVAFSTGGTA